MQPTVNDYHDDPYGDFPWPDDYAHEVGEHRLFGLLPCALQCEQGWLPLMSGDYIACPECSETSPDAALQKL